MRRTLTRDGRQRRSLAADPSPLRDVLGDVVEVGRLVAPLLDEEQSRLDAEDPVWSVRPIGIGRRAYAVVLAPSVVRDANGRIVTTCRSTSASDLPVTLLTVTHVHGEPGAAVLDVTWSLRVEVDLPRALQPLVRPVVDTTVRMVLDDLTGRAIAEIEG